MKKLLAGILSFMLVAAFVPAAYAADDTTAPVLNGVTINATEFSRGDTLVVTADVTELESGLKSCSVQFVCPGDPDPAELKDLFSLGLVKVSDSVMQGSIVLDEKVAGTYILSSVRLVDIMDNESNYCKNYENVKDLPNITGPVPVVSFTLASDYVRPPYVDPNSDPRVPKITGFKLSKNPARVGDTVTYTIAASAPTGVADVKMTLEPFEMPSDYSRHAHNGLPWYLYRTINVPFTPVPEKPGVFAATFNITPDLVQAVYYPSVSAVSNDGYSANDLWFSELPGQDKTILKVYNPNFIAENTYEPWLTSYSVSSRCLIPGQEVSITASLNIKTPLFDHMSLGLINLNTGNYCGTEGVFTNQGENRFTGTVRIPLNVKAGRYAISGFGATVPNMGGAVFPGSFEAIVKIGNQEHGYIKNSELTVVPLLAVSGTHNETILAGSSFDPMEGVAANNAYTGDVTDKIAVSGGDFDRNAPGMYLVKYKVSDTVTVGGKSTPVSYTDYRWIGVSEVTPAAAAGSAGMPLAVTDGSLAVGASSGDVSLKKDGKSIAYASELRDPGVYTATNGESACAASAVIDRAGPSVSAAWRKTAQGISVTLKAADVAGTAELKYMAGSRTLEECRDGGTAYEGPFLLPAYGACTAYARDNLGNESVRTLSIKSSCTDSAYLSDIGLSTGALSGAFSRKVYSYQVKLGEHTGSVTVTPVAEWDGASVTINGKAVSQADIAVANGMSRVVTIKVKYGTKAHTYRLTISRAKSTNCDLGSLTASAGAFDRPFDPAVTSYRLTLDENTKSVRISDTKASPQARATFSSRKYTLNPGQTKVVKLTVRAQSGAGKTYTITIARDKSTDASLKHVKTNSSRLPLSPAFGPDTSDYAVALTARTGSVTLYFQANGYHAAVYVDGAKRTYKKITLKSGQSAVVRVKVVSQAGTAQEYSVTVSRP
jgi:hypothetical protein